MGCAASASCLTRASAVEPDDADLAVDAPPPPSDGSCFFRVESDRGARKVVHPTTSVLAFATPWPPIKDESSEEGKLSEAVTPHTGSPKECDVETHWAPQVSCAISQCSKFAKSSADAAAVSLPGNAHELWGCERVD
eukprot:3937560-Rhodomonas_salina.2